MHIYSPYNHEGRETEIKGKVRGSVIVWTCLDTTKLMRWDRNCDSPDICKSGSVGMADSALDRHVILVPARVYSIPH